MTPGVHRFRLRAQRSSIPQALDTTGQMARISKLSSDDGQRCQLAVEEALTNIIEHGLGDSAPDAVITLTFETQRGELRITVCDTAPAFNPLDHPTANRSTTLEARGEGGWGVHFMRTLMTEVRYARVDDHNCLTLIKRAGPTSPA